MRNEIVSEREPIINLLIGSIDLLVIVFSIYTSYSLIKLIDPHYIFYFKLKSLLVLGGLSYIPALLYFPPLLYQRIVHVDRILERTFRLIVLYLVIFTIVLMVLKGNKVPYAFILSQFGFSWLLLSIERLLLRDFIKNIRKKEKT